MEKYIEILKNTKLFSGVEDTDILTMTGCLNAQIKSYKKGDYIFRQGDVLEYLCIVLEGCVHIQTDDYWGNRTIISEINVSEMFSESYAVYGSTKALNDAVTVKDSVVAFFNVDRIMTVCSNGCRFHSMVTKNLLISLTHKNRQLIQKLTHITKRSTREKLLSYLSAQSKLYNSNSFSIPFNRQQLADYLSVDRSAMSNELCKMRDEGLIEFQKNNFTLL